MKKRVNISLDDDTVIKLKEMAEASHMNVSQWISQQVWKSVEGETHKKEGVAANGTH